ncbi:MAG: hypothetical protein Q8P97_02420 [bacterium]|nr:hypothetical protein [bacterium]
MTDALLAFQQTLSDFFAPYFGSIKFFSAIISLALFCGIVYVVVKLDFFKSKVTQFSDIAMQLDFTKKRTVRAWLQIRKRMEAGDESNLKLAVIEADKILDEILKRSGFAGETMSERLKRLTSAQLSNLEQVWGAHKLRNRIVHEPNFEVSGAEVELAVSIYGRAFQEFGLID